MRITSSPWPVEVTAPTSLSTNKPAPIIGESPKRPRILKPMPLVVQLPLRFPSASIATIPIVSWFHSPFSNCIGANGPCSLEFSILMTGLYSDFFNHCSYDLFAPSLNSCFSNGKPSATANCCAPTPTSITCGVFSITRRATEIGCFILSKKATLPQLKFSSMMQASSVTKPSLSGLAPNPTQQLCSASVTITPASTASSALPPLPNISHAPLLAFNPASQVEITMGLPVITGYVVSCATIFLPYNTVIELNKDDCKNFLLLAIIQWFEKLS